MLALTDQRLPSLLHRWLLHELMSSHCLEILVLKFNENDQNKKIKQKTTRASLISAVLKKWKFALDTRVPQTTVEKLSLQPHPLSPHVSSEIACRASQEEATWELDVMSCYRTSWPGQTGRTRMTQQGIHTTSDDMNYLDAHSSLRS